MHRYFFTILHKCCHLHVLSVDTVKTRLQGQPPTRVQKYTSMMQTYTTIFKQEGVMRGLYAGVTPAMIGSSKSHIIQQRLEILIHCYI